jgi:hypothetical protein
MARNYGRMLTTIWADPDWRERSPDAQWLYGLLLSQPGISHAGVTGLQVRRWSQLATGMTDRRVRKALAELAKSRFVVVDDVTEELFIRTFVRNDGVLEQPQVVKAMTKAYRAILSPALRAEFLDQLHDIATRIANEELDEPKSWKHAEPLLTEPYPKGYGPQMAQLIHLASETA